MKSRTKASELPVYLEKLRTVGLKVTSTRIQLLTLMQAGSGSWTLETLSEKARQSGIRHESTVYRNLESFVGAGIAEEFKLPGLKASHFALVEPGHNHPKQSRGKQKGRARKKVSAGARDTHPHHHHVLCEVCHVITHLDMCLPHNFIHTVQKATRFKITQHQLEFRGICPECARRNKVSAA